MLLLVVATTVNAAHAQTPAPSDGQGSSPTEAAPAESAPPAEPQDAPTGSVDEQVAAVPERSTEPPQVLPEIGATATVRRRDTSLQSTPVSATVLGKAQLERSEVRDLTDIEALSPNVTVDAIPVGHGTPAVTIRGIGFREVEKTFDPAVGIVLDGVYLGTLTTALLNNFDLESIEVLRGPQGTLFGRNTTAGVINVRRARPTGVLGTTGSVTVGSWGRNDYKASLDFPIVEGTLAGKVSFYSFNLDGIYRNLENGERLPNDHYLSGSADLLYTPNARSSYWLKYERVYDRQQSIPLQNASDQRHLVCFGPPLGLTTFAEAQCRDPNAGRYDVRSRFRNDMRLDLDALTLNADWKLGERSKLLSVSGFRGHDEDLFQDFDGTAEDFYSQRRTQRYDQLSQELRIESQPLDVLSLVVGSYYFYGRYDMDATAFFIYDQPVIQSGIPALAGAPPGNVRVQDVGQTTHSVAGFASADVEVVDDLHLSAGGRYTYETKSIDNDLGYSNTRDAETARRLASEDDERRLTAKKGWANFTPKAGVDYTLPSRLVGANNTLMVYGSWARGFRSGGFNTRADPATTAPYGPEVVDQFETGLKTSWVEHRLFVNVATFTTSYRDKQEDMVIVSPSGGQQTVTRNAARAEIRGLELEVMSTPVRGLNAIVGGLRTWLSLGLLDAEYTRFVTDLNGPTFTGVLDVKDYGGMPLRDAAKWQLGVGVSNPYEISGFGRVIAAGQYRRRAAVRSAFTVTSATNDGLNERLDDRGISPAYEQLDASLTLEVDELLGGAWRVTTFGRNLTGTQTRIGYLDISGLFAFQAYYPPAQWGVELAATY